MRFLIAISLLACATGCGRAPQASQTRVVPSATLPAPNYDAAFWKVWSDGQAELNGYDLTMPRYGEPRRGVAVAIFVTETFSQTLRVKADPGKHPPIDEFPVMELNLVKDYQTGIYDYNEMLSSFVALASPDGRGAGRATKISFSRQEWCGNTWHQLLFDADTIRATRHSYFDGDGDAESRLNYPGDGVAEDALLLWARGMARPALAPGETRGVALLPALAAAKGTAAVWKAATLSRSPAPLHVTVPAGTFEVELLTARLAAQDQRTFYVETAWPHRLIRWESSSGEHAELLKSVRLKYWEMNGPGNEKALKELGLAARPPRTT